MMRQFYTPPITNPKFDSSISIRESYGADQSSNHVPGDKATYEEAIISGSIDIKGTLTKEEIDEALESVEELPPELIHLIDLFIVDLKEPKYSKPLSIIQLASLFQGFYAKFDKASLDYLSNSGPYCASNNSIASFINARDNTSAGLSGIFARSRSGSTTSGATIRGASKSSSLFSLDSKSGNNITQLLTPEDISNHARLIKLNSVKVRKYMELCEDVIFQKLLEVGTSVSSPPKRGFRRRNSSLSGRDSAESTTENVGSRYGQETFNVTSFFRNSPEYVEFDKLLSEKIQCLSRLDSNGQLDLHKFLGVSVKEDSDTKEKEETIKDLLFQFSYNAISPCAKNSLLLKIHDVMMDSEETSNDEFLSMLIYFIIKSKVSKLLLGAEFIRLFRYKKELTGNWLFVLTNLEAALTFIGSQTVKDFPDELQKNLTPSERRILDKSINKKIPLAQDDDGSKATATADMPQKARVRSATTTVVDDTLAQFRSAEGLKATIDNSVRSVIGKIKAYSPPGTGSRRSSSLPRSSSQLSIEYANNADGESPETGYRPSVNPRPSWRKYKNRVFEDLTVSELREVFELYQKMVR